MRKLIASLQKKKSGEKKRRWRTRINNERRNDVFKLRSLWKRFRESEKRFERQINRDKDMQ